MVHPGHLFRRKIAPERARNTHPLPDIRRQSAFADHPEPDGTVRKIPDPGEDVRKQVRILEGDQVPDKTHDLVILSQSQLPAQVRPVLLRHPPEGTVTAIV